MKHAFIKIEKGIVYIILNAKDKDNVVRCRFSIAHELGHLAFSHVALPSSVAYKMLKHNIAQKWIDIFHSREIVGNLQIPEHQLKNMYISFVKQVGKASVIPSTEFPYLFKPVYVKANKKLKELNYNIAHEWGRIVFDNNYYCKDLSKDTPIAARPISSNPFSKTFRSLFTKEWGRDELADHFAANLLVPLDRFQHYLDKSDKELAKYFSVEEKCIKKRRKEFKAEMNVLTAAVKPLAIEKIPDFDAEYITKDTVS
jgi:Zn-dependent peptidase ImmA (M78 family)